MLDSLLTNAIRHTPAGGEVTVSVTTSDGSVECEITDSGPGFPTDQLETVFDRFTKSGDLPTGGARVSFTLPGGDPGT